MTKNRDPDTAEMIELVHMVLDDEGPITAEDLVRPYADWLNGRAVSGAVA